MKNCPLRGGSYELIGTTNILQGVPPIRFAHIRALFQLLHEVEIFVSILLLPPRLDAISRSTGETWADQMHGVGRRKEKILRQSRDGFR